jgi:hypothetical protein
MKLFQFHNTGFETFVTIKVGIVSGRKVIIYPVCKGAFFGRAGIEQYRCQQNSNDTVDIK